MKNTDIQELLVNVVQYIGEELKPEILVVTLNVLENILLLVKVLGKVKKEKKLPMLKLGINMLKKWEKDKLLLLLLIDIQL